MTLVSAIPGDGRLGSTPTSGASIDPEKETTDVTIQASDHPYGNQALSQDESLFSGGHGLVENFFRDFLQMIEEELLWTL